MSVDKILDLATVFFPPEVCIPGTRYPGMSQGTALQTIDGKVFFYCIRVDTVRPRPFRVDDDKCDCLDGDTDATADRVLRLLATAVVGHVLCVCVCFVMFFTLNRSFYPSTSNTTSVRADCSILEQRYKLCGHKTTPQRYCNSWYEVPGIQ